MKRAAASVVTGIAVAVLAPFPAIASTHQATIGNYYYEDDQQRDRTKIVVHEGDRITFTVRDPSYPPHTVDVDALDIHSPDLIVGATYETPPLTKVGNFYLYCRPHEADGHHTRLVVSAAPKPTAKPAAPAPSPNAGSAAATPALTTATATVQPESPTPIGVAIATPGAHDRPTRLDPNSVEALTGHRRSNRAPWTSSLWLLLIATVPIVGAGVVALRRARVAEYQPKVENMRRIRAQTAGRAPKARPRQATGHKSKPKR